MKTTAHLKTHTSQFQRSTFWRSCAILLTLGFLGLTTLSCSKTTDLDKVGEAEYCLDKATPATALDCVAKVDGIISPAADNIRCAGTFLYEKLTDTQNLLDAMDALAESTSDPIETFMGFLIFNEQSTKLANKAKAAEAFDYCLNSGGKASTLIASFTYLATSLLNGFVTDQMYLPSPAPDPSTYDTDTKKVGAALAYVLGSIVANELSATTFPIPTSVNDLFGAFGAVVISTHNISCNSSQVNDELCGYMKTAVDTGGTDEILVGRTFFKTLAVANQ